MVAWFISRRATRELRLDSSHQKGLLKLIRTCLANREFENTVYGWNTNAVVVDTLAVRDDNPHRKEDNWKCPFSVNYGMVRDLYSLFSLLQAEREIEVSFK
jgi:hypothetical protein